MPQMKKCRLQHPTGEQRGSGDGLEATRASSFVCISGRGLGQRCRRVSADPLPLAVNVRPPHGQRSVSSWRDTSVKFRYLVHSAFPGSTTQWLSSKDIRVICGPFVWQYLVPVSFPQWFQRGKCTQRPHELHAQQKILRAFLFIHRQLPEDSLAPQKPHRTFEPFLMGTSLCSKVLWWIRG